MDVRKVFGFLAVAGLLVIAAPADHAQAAVASPGIAAAVQTGGLSTATEVHWRRHWHRHHYYRHHHHWRRHYWRRHHWHRHHWHRHHW